jgi:hypothetical protein
MKVEWLASDSSSFTTDTHWMGGWVDPDLVSTLWSREKFLVPAWNRTPGVKLVADLCIG